MIDRKVTLITGTRKGIGRYLAEHYVGQGHLVVGCSRGKPDWSLEGYRHFELDVADEKAVRQLFLAVAKDYGRLDHLINNAGIGSMNHFMLTPLRSVESIFSTNVVGTFLFCREGAKMMQPRKWGRIVNFTTVATPMKLEGEAVYAASKAAVFSLTEVLARELGGLGITVNSLGPTPIDTDLIRGVPKDRIDRLIARQAIQRLGTFADVANVTDFFLSAASDFITGQNLYLGGL